MSVFMYGLMAHMFTPLALRLLCRPKLLANFSTCDTLLWPVAKPLQLKHKDTPVKWKWVGALCRLDGEAQRPRRPRRQRRDDRARVPETGARAPPCTCRSAGVARGGHASPACTPLVASVLELALAALSLCGQSHVSLIRCGSARCVCAVPRPGAAGGRLAGLPSLRGALARPARHRALLAKGQIHDCPGCARPAARPALQAACGQGYPARAGQRVTLHASYACS